MLKEIIELLNANLERVGNLLDVYDGISGDGKGRRSVDKQDVLRSAVVMLHSSMEEFLRDLLIWRAPQGNKSVVDSYPLVGSKGQFSEKFSLGSLVEHKGKTVDELIEESVRKHLEQYASFNNMGDVAGALNKCGVTDYAIIRHKFSDLEEMIKRRHNIVHRADRNPAPSGSGHHQATSINVSQVKGYLSAVCDLRDFVAKELEKV